HAGLCIGRYRYRTGSRQTKVCSIAPNTRKTPAVYWPPNARKSQAPRIAIATVVARSMTGALDRLPVRRTHSPAGQIAESPSAAIGISRNAGCVLLKLRQPTLGVTPR